MDVRRVALRDANVRSAAERAKARRLETAGERDRGQDNDGDEYKLHKVYLPIEASAPATKSVRTGRRRGRGHMPTEKLCRHRNMRRGKAWETWGLATFNIGIFLAPLAG